MRKSQEDRQKFRGVWIPEECPECGGKMLGNAIGEKWCSICDHGITDFTVNGRCVQISERPVSER